MLQPVPKLEGSDGHQQHINIISVIPGVFKCR